MSYIQVFYISFLLYKHCYIDSSCYHICRWKQVRDSLADNKRDGAPLKGKKHV